MNPASDAFSTVPLTNYLGLLPPEGPNWKATRSFLSLKKEEVAVATGVSRDSVRFDSRIPEELRQRLTEIATICELVAQHFEGDVAKTALWFRVPNPLLGDMSPRDMIRVGRYKKLLKFVQSAIRPPQKAAAR